MGDTENAVATTEIIPQISQAFARRIPVVPVALRPMPFRAGRAERCWIELGIAVGLSDAGELGA